MSAQIANLIVFLDEIDDNIACREADLKTDPDDEKAANELDNFYCRRADIIQELQELKHRIE